jgi:hypothetical protein
MGSVCEVMSMADKVRTIVDKILNDQGIKRTEKGKVGESIRRLACVIEGLPQELIDDYCQQSCCGNQKQNK